MLKQHEIDAIKATLQTAGWPIIEAILQEETDNVCRITTKGKRFEDIAVEAIAVDKVNQAFSKAIKRINSATSGATIKPVVYR